MSEQKQSNPNEASPIKTATVHPIRPVNTAATKETVECLERLLAMAKSGELIGVALVAMLKHRDYFTHATGETYRNPTFTRGMLRVLDDDLGRLITGR